MLFVPSPGRTHPQFGSVWCMGSSVRQTPPPAVPTQSRQLPAPPPAPHRGDTASVLTRPEMLAFVPLLVAAVVGPSLRQREDCPPPAITAANASYRAAVARTTSGLPTGAGKARSYASRS